MSAGAMVGGPSEAEVQYWLMHLQILLRQAIAIDHVALAVACIPLSILVYALLYARANRFRLRRRESEGRLVVHPLWLLAVGAGAGAAATAALVLGR